MKTMLLLLSVFTSAFAFGGNAVEKEEEKIYISADQIYIHDNVLLLNIQNTWVSVGAICRDANGIYVKSSFMTWDCGHCGFPNRNEAYFCKNCRYPRGG